jgi:hypothetical protein
LNTKNNEDNLFPNIQLLFVAGPNLLQKNDATTLEATKIITKCVVCFDHPSTTSIEVFFFFRFPTNIAKKIPSCAF